MPKGTILDRLAGAMKTLGKREGKALTPRQRVAAAQHWNSLARIADDRLTDLDATSEAVPYMSEEYDRIMDAYNKEGQAYNNMKLLVDQGNAYDNPFLSDNIDKYQEQSEFLDWCRYNNVEPNARSLKQFRWETYKTLPYRQQQWIANKDAIKSYLGPEMYGYDKQELGRINTLDELEDYLQTRHPEDNWPRRYPMQDSPVFESPEEFPDNFNYMWRY